MKVVEGLLRTVGDICDPSAITQARLYHLILWSGKAHILSTSECFVLVWRQSRNLPYELVPPFRIKFLLESSVVLDLK